MATLLDGSAATARMIADQLGHSWVSMKQDLSLGRRSVDPSAAEALEGFDPDAVWPSLRRRASDRVLLCVLRRLVREPQP